MKNKYEKPLVEVFDVRNLSFLEYFSGDGTIDQFGDGGLLDDVEDLEDFNL